MLSTSLAFIGTGSNRKRSNKVQFSCQPLAARCSVRARLHPGFNITPLPNAPSPLHFLPPATQLHQHDVVWLRNLMLGCHFDPLVQQSTRSQGLARDRPTTCSPSAWTWPRVNTRYTDRVGWETAPILMFHCTRFSWLFSKPGKFLGVRTCHPGLLHTSVRRFTPR